MKIFKYIFFLLLIVIIGGSIYIATLNGIYQTEETKVIKAPTTMVFNEVNQLKNWENWGPWTKNDNTLVFNYSEKTKGEGASYHWQSENNNDGKITTTEVIPNKSIQQEITYPVLFGESTSTLYWLFEKNEGNTKITWEVKGERTFFDKIRFLLQGESITEKLQPIFKESLVNLDSVISEKMKKHSIHIDGITEYAGGYSGFRIRY